MNCPLCGGKCQKNGDSKNNTIVFRCLRFNRSFRVGASIDVFRDEDKQRRLNNLIFEYVMEQPYADNDKTPWWFYNEPNYISKETDEKSRVNLAEIHYPSSLSEKIDRILLNLYHVNSNYGHEFRMDDSIHRAFFAETIDEENTQGIVFLMLELAYLTTKKEGFYKIAAKGWERIEDLHRLRQNKRQGFIAMAFRPAMPLRQMFD